MLLKIYPDNPSEKAIRQVVELLHAGGLIVYPTDSLYAYGAALCNPRGVDRLRQATGKTGNNFSIICNDLSTVAAFARVDTPTFKLLKRNLPGPFTFLLEASSKMPERCLERKKTVGVRIPSNPIARAIVEALEAPLVSASVKNPDLEEEYTSDPSLIHEYYGDKVDAVIDGGYGYSEPSTIVDCTGDEPLIIRQGIGLFHP